MINNGDPDVHTPPPASEGHRLQEIPDHVKDYVEAKVGYYKLTAIEVAANASAVAVSWSTLIILGLFGLVFLSIGLGLYLGSVLDSMHQGFLIVGGIYLLLIIVVLLTRERLIHVPVINAIITKLANPSEHETKNN